MPASGQKPRPIQPHHVAFRRQRTLVRASIRWSAVQLCLEGKRLDPRGVQHATEWLAPGLGGLLAFFGTGPRRFWDLCKTRRDPFDAPRRPALPRWQRDLRLLLVRQGRHSAQEPGELVRVRPLRCPACGAELILTGVVPDDTARLRGCEHHTFICSACYITERRVVFTRHGREDDSVPVLPEAVRRMSLPLSNQAEQFVSAGLLGRVVSRLRGH